MGEIDYQMALILQHKYQQERFREDQNIKSIDFEYAKSLQEQFDKENAVEQPCQDLVYKKSKTRDSTKSLTDPSWEVIDPTPDIHMLFIAFNERFFWNKLLTVCVGWSKRMTTCAGICSYQGRSGMCNISLSEPLLKLRPRKDLVETLLHEMIHAYLFLTNNNRDRDGHGPEFHNHMNRINEEAGTNITVYHDFHDEVRLYQQHWWKCDGPCQNWKPYFGMVRRALNRAPGPTDRWWGEHSRSCGGTFIKVREPEKVSKKTASKQKSTKNNAGDIRKYISGDSPKQVPKKINSDTPSKPSISKSVQNIDNPSNSNIKGFSNTNKDGLQVGTVITSKVNNIVGFTNNHGKSNTNSSKKTTNIGGLATANRNGSIVIKKPNRVSVNGTGVQVGSIANNIVGFTNDANNTPEVPRTIAKTVTSTATSNIENRDYSVVRNHWANKFSNSSDNSASSSQNKRKSISSTSTPSKTRKVDPVIEEMVDCPVCNNKILAKKLNSHLDNCLNLPDEMECVICGTKVQKSDYGSHVDNCAAHNLSNDDDVFTEPEEKQCTVCNRAVPSTQYDIHLETCLQKMFDDMERKIAKDYETKNTETVACLACNKKIRKSELNMHLEDCMNVSNIFVDDDDEPEEATPHKMRYNCPCCMELILESDMSFHINRCLDIASDVPKAGDNRTLLAVALSDDSFN